MDDVIELSVLVSGRTAGVLGILNKTLKAILTPLERAACPLLGVPCQWVAGTFLLDIPGKDCGVHGIKATLQ
jgi:hypothetical protein